MNPARKPMSVPIEPEPDDVQADGSHWEPGTADAELDLLLGPMVAP